VPAITKCSYWDLLLSQYFIISHASQCYKVAEASSVWCSSYSLHTYLMYCLTGENILMVSPTVRNSDQWWYMKPYKGVRYISYTVKHRLTGQEKCLHNFLWYSCSVYGIYKIHLKLVESIVSCFKYTTTRSWRKKLSHHWKGDMKTPSEAKGYVEWKRVWTHWINNLGPKKYK
jgi:hypothetical protein